MKHTWKITAILISMFLATQLIGLVVVHAYTPNIEQVKINGELINVTTNPLPYNLEPPSELDEKSSLISIIIAFIMAIIFIFLLTKLKATLFIRLWFFFVVTLVVGITLNALANYLSVPYNSLVSLAFAIPLAIWKIFKRNIIVHNVTELMIYPGIAVVFIPLLNVWTIIILLIIISLYDVWAVWHSGFMQKMAKFQINELKIFGGFFVPYLNKKQRIEVKNAKLRMKKGKPVRNKKMKVNLAILGGGDVVFPIIVAGIVLRSIGIIPALIVVLGATASLFLLFVYSQKGKFYPAMPFITAGLLIGMALAYII